MSSTGAMPVPILAATPHPPDLPPASVCLAGEKCEFHPRPRAFLLAAFMLSVVWSLVSCIKVTSACEGLGMLVAHVSKQLALAVSMAHSPLLRHQLLGSVHTATARPELQQLPLNV